MIFAELEYKQDYWDVHDELLAYISGSFCKVQSGHQGDSWIWVFDGESKVEIDTFSSMKHQVKCADKESQLVQEVIRLLSKKYQLRLLEKPESEPHEE